MHNHRPTKIKPIDNPYHKSSATVTTDTKSQIFLLNERSKVILSESSDEEQIKIQLKNEPTLNKKSLTHKQSYSQQNIHSKYQKKQQSIPNRQQQQHNQQIPAQQEMNFHGSGLGTSPIINNLARTSEKPMLASGKQVSQSRTSLIDKIKQQNFMESRVVKPVSQFVPTTHKKRKKIFDSQAKKHIQSTKKYQQEQQRAKMRRRKQIEQERLEEYERRKIQNQLRQKQERMYKQKQRRQRDQRNPSRLQQNLGCPHTQCLAKSIDIIDKLTDNSQISYQSPKRIKQSSDIEKIILQINLEMDTLHSLPLEQINKQNSKIKVKWANSATQQLLSRVKQENHVDSKVFHEVQGLCQSVNYFQIVRQKYQSWKTRLQKLGEITQDILLVGKQKKLQKLCILQNELSSLQKSQIFQKQNKYPLIEAYNDFIFRQKELLNKTYQWIRQKHF